MCKKCNGYSNYETWAVNLWIDNDEGLQTQLIDDAERLLYDLEDKETVIYNLSGRIKEFHEENITGLETFGVYRDLLNSALSMVNWREIAENIVNGVIENQETEA